MKSIFNYIFKSRSDKTFYYIASAGFGTRLSELISAYFTANMLGAKFKFVWLINYANSLHGIPSAHEIFTKDFNDKHLLNKPPNKFCLNIINRTVSIIDLLKIKFCRHIQIKSIQNPLSNLNIHFEYFNKIPFNKKYLEIINYVNNLPIHKYGIHIRRGDIAYGNYRCGGIFVEKMLPLPIIELLINKLKPDVPLILGEPLFIDSNKQFKIYFPDSVIYEYPHTYDKSLIDFFDLCLFGRCKKIIGGASKYLQCGTLINKCDHLPINHFLSDQEIDKSLIDFIYNSNFYGNIIEISLACDYYISRNYKKLSGQKIYELTKRAFECDDKNPAYFIKLISYHLTNYGVKNTEYFINTTASLHQIIDLLLDITYSHLHDGTNSFANLSHPKGSLNLFDWEILHKHASTSSWIQFFSSLYYLCLLDKKIGNKLLKKSLNVIIDESLIYKLNKILSIK